MTNTQKSWMALLACIAIGCDAQKPAADTPTTPSDAESAQASPEVTATTGPSSAEDAGWTLLFHDPFDGDSLNEHWEIVDGNWAIEEGHLRGSGTLVSSQGFNDDNRETFLRLEFVARTDVQPLAFLMFDEDQDPEVIVSDLSSMIHATSPGANGEVWRTGYFFQFGGHNNTANRIRRDGDVIWADTDPATLIEPDHWYRIVVENDHGILRFYVDDTLIQERSEAGDPSIGPDRDRVGLYFYTAAKVREVKVFGKLAND